MNEKVETENQRVNRLWKTFQRGDTISVCYRERYNFGRIGPEKNFQEW